MTLVTEMCCNKLSHELSNKVAQTWHIVGTLTGDRAQHNTVDETWQCEVVFCKLTTAICHPLFQT